MTKIYCMSCGKNQTMRIDPMKSDALNGKTVWGDICCSKCHLVIATITVEEPGIFATITVDEPGIF